MAEHIKGGGVPFDRLSPCRIIRVTFLNGAVDAQGIVLSNARMPSAEGQITLKGSPGITSQFDLDGYPFPDGFTVHPTAATVTNIIVAYTDEG